MAETSDRLCLFLPNLCGGGTERVMLNLAGGFAERGVEVDMVLSSATGPYLAEVPESVRIVDLNSHRVLFSLPRLADYLRRERPRVMLSTMTHANVVALVAKRLSRVSTRSVVLVPTTLSVSSRYSSNIRGQFMPLIARCFYRFSDGVVAVSRGAGDDLIRSRITTRDRIKIIYDPVVTPDIIEKAQEPVDHPWFDSKDVPVILGVGRLIELKDYPTLIRAFAKVREEYPVRLVILGEGEERLHLESLIRELDLEADVDLPGFVDNPFAYMARASVFVLSSLLEGLPNALIQAMAVGTPVVATDCRSGPREILDNGKYGALVPVGDVDRMTQSILDILRYGQEELPFYWLDQFRSHHAVSAYLEYLGYSA